jgi:hypothetical protein
VESEDRDELRDEIIRLLAAALAADTAHLAETGRRDELHVAEIDRRDQLHVDELRRRQDLFDHENATIRAALETRDLIGQAKGVIIASTACSSDEAYLLLKTQSQAENRKLNEIAAEIVAIAQRRR